MIQKNIYKGRRYVPLVDGIWDVKKSYEALTIVLWQGNSYTSKKDVPRGVYIGNEEYWVCTGNYNAQVEMYRQEVKGFNSKLCKLDTQVQEIVINITKYKCKTNDWNEAFDLAYAALPEYGGTILIPYSIEIYRSIDLIALGTKKVMIIGHGKMNNPGTQYNSVIIKMGDFDGIVLGNGCGMKNISVSRNLTKLDNHDGIHVSGITCTLENVQVNQQGGNGIRVGSKTDRGKYNCNIGRFTNVGSYKNNGWGVVVRDDFAKGINTSDANALVFIASDIRDNEKGGILFEKCMDNQMYSPNSEVNRGEAGIKVGEETSGIAIYSSYTENPKCLHDILLTAESKDNIVMGFRSGINNDRITDLGLGNYVLGKLGSKFRGYYYKNIINGRGLNICKPETIGYFSIQQEDNNSLSIISGGGAGKYVTLKSNTSEVDVGLVLKDMVIGGKDKLNSVRLRPQVTTVQTTIPPTSSVFANRIATDIKVSDLVILNPYTSLPSGVTFYATCEIDGNVKITMVNTTQNTIVVPDMNWKCLGISVTTLR